MVIPCLTRWRISGIAASVLIASTLVAQESPENKGDAKPSSRTDVAVPSTESAGAKRAELIAPAKPAVEKGLKYLASRQQEDGAFATSGYGKNAAVVALAGMAWLANGSTPGRGPY